MLIRQAVRPPTGAFIIRHALRLAEDTRTGPAKNGAVQPSLFDPRLRKDIDILFVIANSPSIIPKQKVLAAAIPRCQEPDGRVMDAGGQDSAWAGAAPTLFK
ncbi:MAG TPA: hypothetical protein PLW65_14665 [Pseudomonadota bacterium]|nr:hypothetical protein [Pseudomonadota bacterium]